MSEPERGVHEGPGILGLRGMLRAGEAWAGCVGVRPVDPDRVRWERWSQECKSEGPQRRDAKGARS